MFRILRFIPRRAGCGALSIGLLASASLCTGQSRSDTGGFYLYERLDSTVNTLGFITRVDSTAGYKINRYLAIDAGIPVYIVRPSEATLGTSGIQRVNGLGNAHLAVRLTAATPAVTYLGSVTATAPTGDENAGLSTGKATIDWNNHFERSFGRFTPFGALGIANSIADTPFFMRPYTSQGLVTHFEGGARFALAPRVSVGGSLYAYEPSGDQTVVSRVRKAIVPASQGRSRRDKTGVFELSPVTTGPAEIARDRGGSVWLSAGPVSVLDFQIGYSRSTTYALDTVFFGVGVNLSSIFKR